MNKEFETTNRELLSASIAYVEAVELYKSNRGRGVKGGLEKAKLALLKNDARVRLVKAQNATLAVIRKGNGK